MPKIIKIKQKVSRKLGLTKQTCFLLFDNCTCISLDEESSHKVTVNKNL